MKTNTQFNLLDFVIYVPLFIFNLSSHSEVIIEKERLGFEKLDQQTINFNNYNLEI